MSSKISKTTLLPPPGRPNWKGTEDLPLLYLSWGERNYFKAPLKVHYDMGSNYFILLKGEITLLTQDTSTELTAPHGIIISPDCAFGFTQRKDKNIEMITWVWQGSPQLPSIAPAMNSFRAHSILPDSIVLLKELHLRCQEEVARADDFSLRNLEALRTLIEVELYRGSQTSVPKNEIRWELVRSWMLNNLSIHTPVPALCDYMGMSPSSLHRFFISNVEMAPGAYFRKLKQAEAIRLLKEGHQQKAVAYQLGYKHPNDLSRAIGKICNQVASIS
jgi:AraC-like DNA-binding protein